MLCMIQIRYIIYISNMLSSLYFSDDMACNELSLFVQTDQQ